MDMFDASDFDFLLSKRCRKWAGLALVIGIAFVPPVKSWYFGQIERHAQHITREIQGRLTPEVSEQSPSPIHSPTPAYLNP